MKTTLQGMAAALVLAACSHEEASPRHAGSPPFESNIEAERAEAVAPEAALEIEGSARAERDLCAELTREGRLDLEEVPGGVALVAEPKPGQKLDGVLHAMRNIHDEMTPDGNLTARPGVPVVAPRAPDRCALFDAARAGARADIDATPGVIRLAITSGDPSAIQAIREGAKRFVDAARSAPPAL
jgi:hypothetical protein